MDGWSNVASSLGNQNEIAKSPLHLEWKLVHQYLIRSELAKAL